MDTVKNLISEIRTLYLEDNRPWILQVSFGKDSAFMTAIVWEAIRKIPIRLRTKPVYIISSDTLVESPVMSSYVKRSVNKLNQKAKENNLPIQAYLSQPDIKNRFFYKVLGRGTLPPSPKSRARWCTEHLKIRHTKELIESIIKKLPVHQVFNKSFDTYDALVFLGVRSEESARRKASIESFQLEGKYAKHSIFQNLLCYHPIRDVLADEIWLYLLEINELPYGIPVSELEVIYGESFGECGANIDSQDKACGAIGSRSGCWVCPLSKYEDPMLHALIKEGYTEYTHLLHWKQKMTLLRNDVRYRENLRRVEYQKKIQEENGLLFNDHSDGRYVSFLRSNINRYDPGPFSLEARYRLLEDLLYTQEQVKEELISEDEIQAILDTWALEGFYVRRNEISARRFNFDGSLVLNQDGTINARETTVKHPIYRVRVDFNMQEPQLLKFIRERQNVTKQSVFYYAYYKEHSEIPVVYNYLEFLVCKKEIQTYSEAQEYIYNWLGWHVNSKQSKNSYSAGINFLLLSAIKDAIDSSPQSFGTKSHVKLEYREEETGQLSFEY